MDYYLLKIVFGVLVIGFAIASPHHHHQGLNAGDNAIEITEANKTNKTLLSVTPISNSDVNTEAEKDGGIGIIIKSSVTGPKKAFRKNNSTTNCTHPHHVKTKHVDCVCGLFSMKSPIETDAPLLSKTFYNVSCHAHHVSGADPCTEVCVSFGMNHYNEKDNIICSRLYNATNLTGYLYSKICDESTIWTYTGLESQPPLCCKKGQPVPCEGHV